MIGPAWNPGARVMVDTEPLNLSDGPWPCTVIQSTATHALIAPDTPWRDTAGNFIQPWVPIELLTPLAEPEDG